MQHRPSRQGHTVNTTTVRSQKSAIAAVIVGTSCCVSGQAQTDEGEYPDIYHRIWSLPQLYQNSDNPSIQSFSLIGRYHGQYWMVRAHQGDARDWENRRMMAGFSAKWWRELTVQAQMYIASDGQSLYDGLYEAYVKWSPGDIDFALSVGRLDYLFTGLERSTSSKSINTIERGMLVNQLMPAEVVGAHARGQTGKLSYHGGVFSGDIEQEFSSFDSGSAAVAGLGYEAPLLFEAGSMHLDMLYNDSDTEEGNAFRPFQYILSAWHRGQSGRLGMGVDITVADSAVDFGTVWGITLEPTWILRQSLFGARDPLQLVVRYQFASSSRDNALTLQRRYEQEVAEGAGNSYQALYSGLNYYLYGQRLKLMFGAEYARMVDDADDGGDYLGWTLYSAVRLYF
jgi:hypothetical protein